MRSLVVVPDEFLLRLKIDMSRLLLNTIGAE